MKNLTEFNSMIEFILTDIDDTLTTEGQLPADSYTALWDLKKAGYKIIPVTGRPAGWCEMIARFWPIDGIIGENGGLYFRYDPSTKKMMRWYSQNEETRQNNRTKLEQIEKEIIQKVSGSAVSSDQFCRQCDLAIDFCEDVPRLEAKKIDQIVQIFQTHGAIAKVSSIHVNGWFGTHDKLTTTEAFFKNVWNIKLSDILDRCIFIGDSPNDEPMFKYFKHSFGVANILHFKSQLKHTPTYVTTSEGGKGFSELTKHLLVNSLLKTS